MTRIVGINGHYERAYNLAEAQHLHPGGVHEWFDRRSRAKVMAKRDRSTMFSGEQYDLWTQTSDDADQALTTDIVEFEEEIDCEVLEAWLGSGCDRRERVGWAVLELAKASAGKILVQYRRGRSGDGRLYALCKAAVQRLTREARAAASKKFYWDIDIANSFAAILNGLTACLHKALAEYGRKGKTSSLVWRSATSSLRQSAGITRRSFI